MPYLFGLLALLNIMFFGYHMVMPSKAPTQAVPTATGEFPKLIDVVKSPT